MNEYYNLKSQYESNINKLKIKIINNKELSNREKQREYKKLKPKCINCKRPVGTIFSCFYDEKEDGRRLKTICGDKTKPCDLNIEMNLGKIIRLEDFLEMDEKDISQLKLEIIKDKNDLIFGYITTEEALEKFEQSKEKLNEYVSSYELTLEKYMLITNNKEKIQELKKLELEIQSNISYIKDALKKESTKQSVHDVILFQIEEMMPKINKRENIMYPYNAVECDDYECKLMQKKITIEQLENNFAENEVGVLSFVTGVRNEKSERNEQNTEMNAKERLDEYLESRF